jgi:hypothetical protein
MLDVCRESESDVNFVRFLSLIKLLQKSGREICFEYEKYGNAFQNWWDGRNIKFIALSLLLFLIVV